MKSSQRKRGKSVSAPSYQLHKSSGHAVGWINGKDHYLGKHGSDESHQRYKQALADHWSPTGTAPKPKTTRVSTTVTVGHLAARYGKHVKTKHGEGSSEFKQVQLVVDEVQATYGHLEAAEFGPIRFENFRQSLIDRELSRGVIKRKSNYVLKMFQQGVKFELIPVELWQRLLALGPVEMQVKPRPKRGAVPLEIVKKTQKELTPVLSDMVEAHRLIGARPTEICMIRPCDIDRTPLAHRISNVGAK